MGDLDIGDTLNHSDRVTAASLSDGPRIVTIVRKEITAYKRGVPKREQYPVALYLAEFDDDQPFRPNLTMRRLLRGVWGGRSDDYIGRRLELYADQTVMLGRKVKPGVRISAMSHISKPVTVTVPKSRDSDTSITVKPLPDVVSPVDEVLARITNADSMDALMYAWKAAQAAGVSNTPAVIAAKDAKKKQYETTDHAREDNEK